MCCSSRRGGYAGATRRLGLESIELAPVVTFKMKYGPNDNEISRLFEGDLLDPAQIHFDPVEVEWVEAYSIPELQIITIHSRLRKS